MREDSTRRALDCVDDMRFDLSQLESLVRVLRREVLELRARVRELEHEVEDLTSGKRRA